MKPLWFLAWQCYQWNYTLLTGQINPEYYNLLPLICSKFLFSWSTLFHDFKIPKCLMHVLTQESLHSFVCAMFPELSSFQTAHSFWIMKKKKRKKHTTLLLVVISHQKATSEAILFSFTVDKKRGNERETSKRAAAVFSALPSWCIWFTYLWLINAAGYKQWLKLNTVTIIFSHEPCKRP